MYTGRGVAPGGAAPPDGTGEEGTGQGEESVERMLAQYVFVREERDREVRLLFRDVPAPDIAASFRAAGAGLISITGERVSAQPPAASTADEPLAPPSAGAAKKKRKGMTEGPEAAARLAGEPVIIYFYALRETVYTVSIALPAGIAGSIAAIYPCARIPEQEVERRLGIVVRSAIA
jgi:hypothetical protein